DRRAFALGVLVSVGLYAPHLLEEAGRGFEDSRAALSVARARREAGGAREPERARLAYPKLALASLERAAYARSLGAGEASARLPRPLEAASDLAGFALVFLGAALGALESLRALARR